MWRPGPLCLLGSYATDSCFWWLWFLFNISWFTYYSFNSAIHITNMIPFKSYILSLNSYRFLLLSFHCIYIVIWKWIIILPMFWIKAEYPEPWTDMVNRTVIWILTDGFICIVFVLHWQDYRTIAMWMKTVLNLKLFY